MALITLTYITFVYKISRMPCSTNVQVAGEVAQCIPKAHYLQCFKTSHAILIACSTICFCNRHTALPLFRTEHLGYPVAVFSACWLSCIGSFFCSKLLLWLSILTMLYILVLRCNTHVSTRMPIIHGVFQTMKFRGGRSAIVLQVGAAACVPIADRPAHDFHVWKIPWIIRFNVWYYCAC